MDEREVVDCKTREGNPIVPADSPLRGIIRGNSQSICADCLHVNDSCINIGRRSISFNGFVSVVECIGFSACISHASVDQYSGEGRKAAPEARRERAGEGIPRRRRS